MMQLTGNITSNGTLSGAIETGDISGSLSYPLARGPSAYEVAVANGYEGTEEQWLESLNGYTPIRGVDYWTKEDIEQIINELKEYIDQVLDSKI